MKLVHGATEHDDSLSRGARLVVETAHNQERDLGAMGRQGCDKYKLMLLSMILAS